MTAPAFHPLKVLDVTRETDDAVALTLEPADEAKAAFAFEPGQHVTLRTVIAGEDVRRNYSICATPGEPLRVAIKRVRGGAFSTWATGQLTAGATIEAMAPHGSFTWTFRPEARATYVGIAGGSGITPILSILKTGLAVERESRFVLLYGNRSSNSIMFLEELAALKNRYLGRLQVYHFLTAEADDVELFNGRIDTARMEAVLESLIDPAAVEAAFICGPGAMMDAAEAALLAAGVAHDRVLVERFTAGPRSAAEVERDQALEQRAAGLKMQVTLEGRRRTLEFDPAQGSILENARAAGLPAPFACKAGVCATCRARLVAGEVEMKVNYGLSEDEVARGYVLTCQAVPLTEGVVLDYDA